MKYNRPGTARINVILGAAIILAGAFSAFGQKEFAISLIQGDKNMSAYEGQVVKASGIVTARTRTGFFLQTPDDKVDSNPNTSEGIFVYTKTEPEADAAIGSMIVVSGKVEEFRPRTEPASLPVTELSMLKGRDLIQVLSKANPLPKPIALTINDFKINSIDQLEKFEGMRVSVAEMTVVAPTGGRVDNKTNSVESNGTFYGIVKGLAKPFREPGFELYDFLFLTDKEKADFKKNYPAIKFNDSNPERLRVETTAQTVTKEADLGSDAKAIGVTAGVRSSARPIEVPALTELKNVVGVMHYGYRTYTILTDVEARPGVSSYIKQVNLPPVAPRQFSVAGMNLENFFDDIDDPGIKEDIVTTESFNKRMKKISLGVRNIMQSPDVIGVTEAENLAALKRLAEKINADTEAAGKPNPKYEAYLIDGNDGRGIDSGFLVKSSRITVIETKQLGKEDKFDNTSTSDEAFLNDRPPLMLRASMMDDKTKQPFEFTAVINHLKSFLGYNDPKRMDSVRTKKRLQAEFLAKLVQQRQTANPQEKIILMGDFNAYQFNDGIVDVIGTIKGKPAVKGEGDESVRGFRQSRYDRPCRSDQRRPTILISL
ncbi:MAG: hypothetical protein IPI76_05855 [Chloracidobacterium sp.]|nr:hypothetical protein [Chloracidobacterium sp.]